MGRGPSAQTSSDSAAVLVEERIGAEYANVKIVADNIDDVVAIAGNLQEITDAAATVNAAVSDAQTAATAAATSASDADTDRIAALAAKTGAETAQTGAGVSANDAAASALAAAAQAANAAASALAAEASATDAGTIVAGLAGGLTGYALVKNSDADFDYDWADLSGGVVSFATLTGDPSDNTALDAALDAKAKLVGGNALTGVQTIDQGNILNVEPLVINNMAVGSVGVRFNRATGTNSFYCGNYVNNLGWVLATVNSGMRFNVGGSTYNTSGYAFEFLNTSNATNINLFIKNGTAGQTGDFLQAVDNTNAIKAKITSSGLIYSGGLAAENLVLTAAAKGAANGVAPLDGDGFVPFANLASLFFVTVNEVASQVEQLALTAQEGDVAIRSDINKSYIHNGGVAGTMADWSELLTPTDQVLSVAGLTGAVTGAALVAALGLDKTDVGLANVDNTADSTKVVASAAILTTARTINGTSFNGSANITLNPRVQTAGANSVTPTFLNDLVIRTGATGSITLNNPTGTAIDGHGLVVRLKDNGTARAISYGTQYRAIGVTLPTTTVVNKTTYMAMIWNATDSKWDVVAVAQEA